MMKNILAGKPVVAVILGSVSIGLFLIAWLYARPAFPQGNPFELISVNGGVDLMVEDESTSWRLTNDSIDDLYIEAIDVSWPQKSGNLRQIIFNGRIYKGSLAAPTVSLDASMLGKEKHRTLKKGKSRELQFKFDQKNQLATQNQFLLSVHFNNGIVVQFDDSVDEPPGDGLPPDPGEAGKLTLEGIDSDSDGVRDDIQRWIALDSNATEDVKTILTARAKSLNALLADSANAVKSEEHIDRQILELSCLYMQFTDDVEGDKQAEIFDLSIDTLFLNTEERVRRWAEANSHPVDGGMKLVRGYSSANMREQTELECKETGIVEGM